MKVDKNSIIVEKSKPKNNLYAILTIVSEQNKTNRLNEMLSFQALKSTNLCEFDKYCRFLRHLNLISFYNNNKRIHSNNFWL